MIIGKPLDRDYRVQLKWNPAAQAYEVAEFAEAK
jgi:hypothetical protein